MKRGIVIGLTGRIAAGKGAIVEFLKEKGFEYCTVSQVIREEAKLRGIEITRNTLQNLGNEVRQAEGGGAWMRKIIEKVDLSKNFIIDGIRNPGEIEELCKLDNFFLISVDAPVGIRFRRVLERGKDSGPKDSEGFLKIDNRDFKEEDSLGQQVGKCMKCADFHLFNVSTLANFYKQIIDVYNEILTKSK